MKDNSEITRLGRGDGSEESMILTKLEKFLESASGNSDGNIIKLPFSTSRKRPRKADQGLPNIPANTEALVAMTFDQWVESGGKLVVQENIISERPIPSEKILGTNNNKPNNPRNPYFVYGIKSLIDNFRLYFWLYAFLHLPIVAYLGIGLAGTFGYPGVFWILTILIVKIAVDATIVALHIGQHWQKLVIPSSISITTFYLLGGAFFYFDKIFPFLERM
jgi:hypothetical protein